MLYFKNYRLNIKITNMLKIRCVIMEDLKKAIEQMLNDDILKIVISNKMNKELKYNKISVSIKEKNNSEYYQVEKFTEKQVFHENLNKDELSEKLFEYTAGNFKQISAWSKDANYDLKISKKGKVHLGRKKADNAKMAINKSHNK